MFAAFVEDVENKPNLSHYSFNTVLWLRYKIGNNM